MAEISSLVPGKTDADLARDIREELEATLKPVCEVLNRAAAAKLTVNFQVGMDMFGRNVVQNISISRPL